MTYLLPAALFIFFLSSLYFLFVFPREKDERYNLIMMYAFKYAYYVLMVTLLATFILSKLLHFEVVNEYFTEAILIDLLVAHLAFTLTAIILNQRI
ncbi:hypothetical protein [Paenibacillus sp. KS-LC4]|uniref:hypothetical protein n=1 Tax=Paenibacillus sp. KS-LC4 TaxID=2979727 RepID=UPI0030CDBAB8